MISVHIRGPVIQKTFEIDPSKPIVNLKQLIKDAAQIEPAEQRLFFSGGEVASATLISS